MKNILRVLRAIKKISQKELAKEVNLTQAGLQKIETGKSDPKLSTANRLAKFFELEIEEIFEI